MKKYNGEQKSTLFVVMITSFMTTFNGSALTLAIPAMGMEFMVSAGHVGWIITAYMLATGAFSVPFGRIADLTSRKKILVTGIIFFTLGTLAMALVPTFPLLILLRVIQGIGGAMIFSTNIAVLITAFDDNERGKVLGYSVACTYIGLSLGPVAGGLLNHYLGWRSIAVVTGLVGLIVIYTAARHLPGKQVVDKKEGFDALGNILYLMAVILTLYGFSTITDNSYAWILLVGGLVSGVLFGLWELKAKDPVIQVRIFRRNKTYTMLNISAFLNFGANFAINYLLSIYFQVVMGYTSQTAGFILIISPLTMALLSPYVGHLSDKVSSIKLTIIGMSLCAICLFSFAFVDINTPLILILVILFISGVGFAVFSTPNTNAIMACVEKKDYGVASSVLATMRSVGHTSSMAIVTVIVSAYMGTASLASAPPHTLIETMHTGFLVFGGLCLLAIVFSLQRKK